MKSPEKDVKDKAGRLLARRMYGSQELFERLTRAGYDREDVKDTIEFLQNEKYLDDEAFAASYIRDKSQLFLKGPRLVRIELIKKGVDKQVIDQALLEHYPKEMCLENASSLLEKWQKTSKAYSREQLYEKLGRKGYGFDVARQAYELMNELKKI